MVQGKVHLCISNYTTALFSNRLNQFHSIIISIIIKTDFQTNNTWKTIIKNVKSKHSQDLFKDLGSMQNRKRIILMHIVYYFWQQNVNGKSKIYSIKTDSYLQSSCQDSTLKLSHILFIFFLIFFLSKLLLLTSTLLLISSKVFGWTGFSERRMPSDKKNTEEKQY